MTKYPKVSVLTITYRQEEYITDTLNGIFMQEYPGEIEVIISNDHSPDNTDEIILDYLAKTSIPNNFDIQYTKQEVNLGILPNFRWALKEATGKYIAFCEGDDYWTDPLKLQKQVSFLETHPDYVVTGTNATVIDAKGEVIKEGELPEWYERDASQNELKKGFWVCTLTICFRNVFTDFPREVSSVVNVDTFLTCLLGEYGKYRFMTDIKPGVYRRHPGGVWSLRSKKEKLKIKINTFRTLARYYKRIGEPEYADFFKNKAKLRLKELIYIYVSPIIFIKRNKS